MNTAVSRLPSLEKYLLKNPSLRIVDPLEEPLKELNKQYNMNLRLFDIFDRNILIINEKIPDLEDIINRCKESPLILSDLLRCSPNKRGLLKDKRHNNHNE